MTALIQSDFMKCNYNLCEGNAFRPLTLPFPDPYAYAIYHLPPGLISLSEEKPVPGLSPLSCSCRTHVAGEVVLGLPCCLVHMSGVGFRNYI